MQHPSLLLSFITASAVLAFPGAEYCMRPRHTGATAFAPTPQHGITRPFGCRSSHLVRSSRHRMVVEGGTSRKVLSSQMQEVRERMEADEDMSVLMKGLRGSNLNDADFATGDQRMYLIDSGDSSGLPLTYQPEVLEAYFSQRPWVVAQRFLQLTTLSSGFLFGLLVDAVLGKMKENEVKRAAVLREMIVQLGPFFIKLGQALSIRPDVLSPKVMVELQQLCDKVPSFDSAIAMAMIEKELGQEVSQIYSTLTPEPIAAASLGQVYKGTLRDGGDIVAVKVQRPGVLETVSLDLYLARKLGGLLKWTGKVNTDLVALLDEFAYRFYDELDYVKEAANGEQFAESMVSLPQIVVPRSYLNVTSRKVLTTTWVDGEKLSQSTADDVQELVNVGVVSFLTQLLETGFFHADPHPGNLIRTPEGRLCILDFGLMTQITEDQKFGLIEAISHLIHRDYSKIGEDFKKLDFIPQDVDVEPIIPALSNVFDAALAGGGAKGINFQELAADLAEITYKFPFRIPPYFALIIRAIGVLEGIALVGNPSFAIVDEAYPYISKRLLTDDSPRLRAALRYMVYGQANTFDVERVIDLLQALEVFMVVSTEGGGEGSGSSTEESAAREALLFFFSEKGLYLRQFVLEEIVSSVDALSRDAAVQLAANLGVQQTGPPGSLSLLSAFAAPLSAEEQQAVENTQKLVQFLSGGRPGGLGQLTKGGGARLSELAQQLTPVLPTVAPAMQKFGIQILGGVTERVTLRVFKYSRERLMGTGSQDQLISSPYKAR